MKNKIDRNTAADALYTLLYTTLGEMDGDEWIAKAVEVMETAARLLRTPDTPTDSGRGTDR